MLPTYPLIHINNRWGANRVNPVQHLQPHQEFWLQIKNSLKSKNQNNKPLQMWFEPTNLVGVEDRSSGRCFTLGVPTELHKFWISQNLLERICSEISALYQNPFQIELVVTGQGSLQT